MFGLTVLVATATLVLVLGQGEGESRDSMGERPCTFSQDCKVYLWPADSGYRCNHGQCVSAGGHPSGWVDATIPKDCDKGGYMDCDCKYVLYNIFSTAYNFSVSQSVFTITLKAPTKAFSWLKAHLRHY